MTDQFIEAMPNVELMNGCGIHINTRLQFIAMAKAEGHEATEDDVWFEVMADQMGRMRIFMEMLHLRVARGDSAKDVIRYMRERFEIMGAPIGDYEYMMLPDWFVDGECGDPFGPGDRMPPVDGREGYYCGQCRGFHPYDVPPCDTASRGPFDPR